VLSECFTRWIGSHNSRPKVTGVCSFKNTLFRSDIHFHVDTATNRRFGDCIRVFDGRVLSLEGEAKPLYPRQVKACQVPKMLVAVDQFHAAVYSPDISRNKDSMNAYCPLV